MNEELSIGTVIAREPDVDLSNPTAATDADGSVPVDIKHLSADPENTAQFREQLHSKSQSKETGNASTVEGKTKHDISESPVLKHSAPNERTLFGKNTGHTSPFVAGKSPHPSQNQSTDGSRKDFHEKSMKFDMSSQSAAPKTSDRQPSPRLKSPATLLRELQTPTTSNGTRTSGVSDVASASIHARNSEAVTKELSSSLVNASATKPTETARQNVPETSKPLSKTDNTASTVEPLSKIKTREHPHSPESASDVHRTAVIDTIPFLRTPTESIDLVQEPTAAQASKSHAMLLAQQIRDHIIDRILVSSRALNDNRTVKVQLSPQLLQDTEVQFTQNGTSLDIRLVSQNKDSVQFLQQHQSDLQTYLQGELKTYRAISVRVPSSQTTAELAQPHDGRSRNRFEYQTADEEETT